MSTVASIEVLEDRIAPAMTFTVTNLHATGTGSLNAAITGADADTSGGTDSIVFSPHLHGTISVTSANPLPQITNNLTITGPTTSKGVPNVTVSGSNQTQILYVGYAPGNTAIDVTITGLRFANGKVKTVGEDASGGAIEIKDPGGLVTIQSSVVTGSKAIGGNGIPLLGGGYSAYGGGIALEAGSLTIISSKITGNTATGGNAVPGYAAGNAEGGGIFASTGTTLVVQTSTLTGNIATGGAGAHGAKGTHGTNGVPHSGTNYGGAGTYGAAGTAGGNAYGGAIMNLGTLTLQSSTVTGNKAKAGNGGGGGAGGAGGNGGPAYSYAGMKYPAGQGGNGGNGGDGGYGGNAVGGGVAYATGTLTQVGTNTIKTNKVIAGTGGAAGAAGAAGMGAVTTYMGMRYGAVAGSKGAKGTVGNSSGTQYGAVTITTAIVSASVKTDAVQVAAFASPNLSSLAQVEAIAAITPLVQTG